MSVRISLEKISDDVLANESGGMEEKFEGEMEFKKEKRFGCQASKENSPG